MADRIQVRRDTAANWASVNPILSQGEPGLDLTNGVLKFGNGVDAWADLTGISGVGGGQDGADGREIELQATATHLQWRYVGDVSWVNLIPLADIVAAHNHDGTYAAAGHDHTGVYSPVAHDHSGVYDPVGSAAAAQSAAQAYADGLAPNYATAGHNHSGVYDLAGSAAAAQAAAIAASQPVDSDLTAIAALTTTTFGRSLLALADAAAARTALELGTAAQAATGDFDAAGSAAAAQSAAQAYADGLASNYDSVGSAAAAQAASQPLDSDLTAIAALTTTAFGRSLLALADAAAARTALGLGTAATSATGDFATAGHNHDGTYSPVGHDHSGVYDPAGSAASAQSAAQSYADGLAPNYATAGHDHTGAYAPVIHDHDDTNINLTGTYTGNLNTATPPTTLDEALTIIDDFTLGGGGGAAWTVIDTNTLLSDTAAISISGITGYDEVEVLIRGRSTHAVGAQTDLLVQCNSDSGSNYTWANVGRRGSANVLTNSASDTAIQADLAVATSQAGSDGTSYITVKCWPNGPTDRYKIVAIEVTGHAYSSLVQSSVALLGSGSWMNLVDGVTSLTISLGNGSWVTGTEITVIGRTL